MEVTKETEEMAKSKLKTVPKGETEQQEGEHQSRKDAKQGKKEAKKNDGSGRGRDPTRKSSHLATRNISTMEPGEELRERSKLLKQPLDCLSSPTDHPRSKLLTSKAQRMTKMTEDLTLGAQVTEPKDKNQNSFPDGEVGPSRSNGF